MTWRVTVVARKLRHIGTGSAYIYCNQSAFRTCCCWLLSSSLKSSAAGDRRCKVGVHPLSQPRHSALQLLCSGVPKITTDSCTRVELGGRKQGSRVTKIIIDRKIQTWESGNRLLRNAGTFLSDYTLSDPRRQYSSLQRITSYNVSSM
jgi:hypothetical protein